MLSIAGQTVTSAGNSCFSGTIYVKDVCLGSKRDQIVKELIGKHFSTHKKVLQLRQCLLKQIVLKQDLCLKNCSNVRMSFESWLEM